ncbi:glycosyltransferase family 2 protein [Candidatus Woesearchaeota archaeon]|nr:glycosyltransferase family 2 protein [Candidatus Woesearchaeota archaeon]
MKINQSISTFFPSYNDEGTIELMYNRLTEVLTKITNNYEIIIVDDCSPDRGGQIADSIAKKDKHVKVIHHEKNKGYGGALRSGFNNSTKDLVFYTDGDAQYDVKELVKLVPYINKYDVVNGYKMKRNDPFYRKLLGSIYQHSVKFLFNLKVKDVDCDFRLMHRKVFDKVKLTESTGLICTEMMRKIQTAGFTIKNVPVHHYPRVYGKSQFFRPKRIIKTLFGLGKQWFKLVVLRRLD